MGISQISNMDYNVLSLLNLSILSISFNISWYANSCPITDDLWYLIALANCRSKSSILLYIYSDIISLYMLIICRNVLENQYKKIGRNKSILLLPIFYLNSFMATPVVTAMLNNKTQKSIFLNFLNSSLNSNSFNLKDKRFLATSLSKLYSSIKP